MDTRKTWQTCAEAFVVVYLLAVVYLRRGGGVPGVLHKWTQIMIMIAIMKKFMIFTVMMVMMIFIIIIIMILSDQSPKNHGGRQF